MQINVVSHDRITCPYFYIFLGNIQNLRGKCYSCHDNPVTTINHPYIALQTLVNSFGTQLEKSDAFSFPLPAGQIDSIQTLRRPKWELQIVPVATAV